MNAAIHTLCWYLHSLAMEKPCMPLLGDEGGWLTAEQTEELVEAGAGLLYASGLRPGTLALLCLQRVGAAAVLADPREAPEQTLGSCTPPLSVPFLVKAGESLRRPALLLTRTEEADLGTRLTAAAGEVISQEEAGCPRGTVMTVRELFFNTPARLKFMKKDAAEGAAVFAAVQRTALSHPEVSVKFIRDGRQELLTPGDGQLKSAVYAVMGRDIALGFLPVKGSGEGMEAAGFASLPTCCRGSRSYQHFFVNGRYVKSRIMTAAVEEAYKNQKMVGKFPGCVIHLTAKPGEVDVNVHPAKTEVKFQREQAVFSTVYYAVLSALDLDHSRPQAVIPGIKPADTVTPNQTALPLRDGAAGTQFMASARFRPLSGQARESAPIAREIPAPQPPPAPPEPKKKDSPFQWVEPLPEKRVPAEEPAPAKAVQPPPPAERTPERPAPVPAKAGPERSAPKAESEAEPVQAPQPEPPQEPWVVRGELFHTYVVVEQGDKALLIDKHAAHERANFDRLKAADYRPMVQELLTPVTFSPAPEERELLLSQGELLAQFGFEVEEFGSNALAVRAAPDYLEAGDIEGALSQLARRLPHRRRGLGVDQVGHRLGAGEVQPAVQKRPLCELPGQGLTGPGGKQRLQPQRQRRRGAVAL